MPRKKTAKKKVAKKAVKKKAAKKQRTRLADKLADEPTVGRPSKYETWMCEKVIKLMEQGAGVAGVAAACGITKETLYQWADPKGEYYIPEFSDSVKTGLTKAEAHWESLGLKAAEGRFGKGRFSAPAWIFAMKNKFGWTDRREVTGSGVGGVTIIVQTGVPERLHHGVTIDQDSVE